MRPPGRTAPQASRLEKIRANRSRSQKRLRRDWYAGGHDRPNERMRVISAFRS
jgi:hypothetical protein